MLFNKRQNIEGNWDAKPYRSPWGVAHNDGSQILNYEILSTNDRRKIKQFRKRIEALKIELRRLKKEEINKQNIGRGRLNDKYKKR